MYIVKIEAEDYVLNSYGKAFIDIKRESLASCSNDSKIFNDVVSQYLGAKSIASI